jgi:hypothetical protein
LTSTIRFVPSIVLNEHFEEDGAIIFRDGVQAQLRGYCEAARLALSLGALAALGEGQKSKCASGEAREAEEDWGR